MKIITMYPQHTLQAIKLQIIAQLAQKQINSQPLSTRFLSNNPSYKQQQEGMIA